MKLNLGPYTLQVNLYKNIWHSWFRKDTTKRSSITHINGLHRCWCGEDAIVHLTWKVSEGFQKSPVCIKHAQEFQKTWGNTESGQSTIWEPVYKNNHQTNALINECKKGKTMTDHISEQMVEAQAQIAIDPETGMPIVVEQTAADVGEETQENTVQ